MTYHGQSYEYESDPYHSQQGYYRQDAGPPSGSSSYDRNVPPPRIRRADNIPPKPSSNYSNPPRSAGPTRGQSPPRKIARTESSGGSSNGNFSHRREASQANSRALEKATIREVQPPDAFAAIQSLVSLLQHQQDLARELQEIQTKNAAIIRLSKRDDISKENKERADKAVEEIANAKRRESASWRKVEEKLKTIIVDLVLHYIEDEKSAIREFVSSQWKAIGTVSSDMEAAKLSQRQDKAPPRQPASMRAATVEDGEIVESPAVPPVALPLPASSTEVDPSDQTSSMSDKTKGKTNPNALSVKIRERLDAMENEVLEGHERMDQLEQMVTELVRAEVANYVDAARARREERKKRIEVAAQTAPAANGLSTSSDSAMDTSSSVDKTPTMAPASVNVSANGVAPTATTPVKPAVATTQTDARSKDDFMSREEVDALLESMRQSMRQEFDTKLFEQGRTFSRVMEEMSAALSTRTANNHRAVSQMITKHYEVLDNHGQCLNRHEDLWAGVLGTFTHIPRPQNAPRT